MATPDGFAEFVTARQAALLRTAYLLTGHTQDAEDLVQTTLVKVVPQWRRIRAELMAVRDALRTLAPRQRAVIVLRYYEGFSEAEIAATLGIAQGTVKSQARAGLASLRRALPAEGGVGSLTS